MKTRNRFFKRIVSFMLIFCMMFTYLPFAVDSASVPFASGNTAKTVDPSALDGWKRFFGPDIMTTANAGGVWTDKSVFADVSAFPANTIELSDPNNFIVALSALAANKEIVGYSTIPTDTVLVLDVSRSMEEEISSLVTAANNAIKKLYETNKNNRIGVVLYSGSSDFGVSTYSQGATTLLPIDRYTTTDRNGNFLTLSSSAVSVNSGVLTSAGADISRSKGVVGGTYIQAGLYEALRMFEDADTVIGPDNFQSGQKRLPVLVLMSDGSPTSATSSYDEVGASNAGYGDATSNSMGFLTQLTASYVMSKAEAHYGCKGESIFYTLGMGVGTDSVALSVLDPANSTGTIDQYWKEYLALSSTSSMVLSVPSTTWSNRTKQVSVYRNSFVTTQNYADRYFSATDGSDLIAAFQALVDEIILQSRYYATNLEGGSPNFSGYLTFEDKIGEYMEVKNILGFYLGDTFYNGSLLASTLGSLGSIETPTDLGWEFIDSVKVRLGITEQTEAITLIENAYRHGQLSYTSATEFSNKICWYAYADGAYAGFRQEGVTTPPAGAVYKITSYGFMGETKGNIRDSDMMYMSVRVAESIATGEQTVHWKIPAALVPMVTYKVTVEGTSVESASNVQLTREDAEPIRLVFETGLKSHINSLNLSDITDAKHVDADGSRIFWTNKFDKTAPNHEDHLATRVFYTPSEENERYYYTVDSPIHTKNGDVYTEVPSTEPLDPNGTYYHSRYIFTADSSVPQYLWEEVSDATVGKAVAKDGVWVIPVGTIYRYMARVREMKSENLTGSIDYYNYPYVRTTNSTLDVEQKLGNNGLLRVYPATAIAITKQVDIVEPGTSTTFNFRITMLDSAGARVSGTFDTVLANMGETVGTAGVATFENGVYETTLDIDKTLYITGLSAGMSYTVEEISTTTDYKVKTVHVNGEYMIGDEAVGTVTLHKVDKVDFLNTPTSEGNLYITKRVEHPYGASYSLADKNLSFEITVELEKEGAPLANKTYTFVNGGTSSVTTDADGKITFTLAPDQTVAIHGIPEQIQYTVTEREVAGDGFTLDSAKSTGLLGTVSATSNAQATLVNVYSPVSVSPEDNEIVLELTKNLEGREWRDGDSFEFVIEQIHPETLAPIETIGKVTVNNKAELTKIFDLTDAVYDAVGTYHYRITETAGNSKTGITYDSQIRRFHVSVTDTDMDGYLEIAGVENIARTAVSVDASLNYTVAATFTNTYAAYAGTSVQIPVQKKIENNNFTLNGFEFGLWDEAGENLIYKSALTDSLGKSVIDISFPASSIGVHKYKLAEVAGNINGMTYSSEWYNVTVTVTDNLDGTVSATYEITDPAGVEVSTTPTFTNKYDPSEAILVLSGKKVLNGRILNTGEFEFNLYKTDSSYSIDGLAPTESVVNVSDGSFIFTALSFDAVGEYYFVINETRGALGGVTYSDQSYKIKATVTDNGGTLEVVTDLAGDITFVNTYTATEANVTIDGSKILSGRDLVNGEFEFTLKDADQNPVSTVKNVGSTLTFDTLTFDKAGVYVFTAQEVEGSLGGITYDKSVYTITVTVTDDSVGALRATVSYKKNGADATDVVFRNTYSTAPFDIEIGGTKELSGRDLREGEFTFILTGGLTGTELERVSNKADKSFAFSGLTVYKANTYLLRVTELESGLGGVSYDTSVYDIAVTVSDDGAGNLYESGRVITKNGTAYTGDIKFENTYTLSDIEHTIGGTKKLEGRELKADEFSFTLYNAKLEGSVAVKDGAAVETVKNAADGSFKFSELTYSKAGTYYYIIEEVEGNLGGISYDKTSYTVKVVVTDKLDGTLGVSTAYTTGDGDVDGVVFTNKYTVGAAKHTLAGKKVLKGRELKADEFSFTLYNAKLEGNTVVKDGAAVETVKNAADGSFKFSELTYSKADTYYYIVEEAEGSLGGVTYDKTVYTVKVVVTDKLDGTFSVVTAYSTDKGAAEGVLFTNEYAASAVNHTVEGTKTLKGRDLSAGEFSFKIFRAKLDGNTVVKDGDAIETVKNAADGKFSFAELTFSNAGTYYFIVEEDTSAAAAGITYDKTVYTVKVEVTDNGTGALAKNVTLKSSEGEAQAIAFVNSYTTPSNPPTGDSGSFVLLFALVLAGGGVFAVLKGKKKEQE